MLKWLLTPDITPNKKRVGINSNIEKEQNSSVVLSLAKLIHPQMRLKDVNVGLVVNPGCHHVLSGFYLHVQDKLQRYTVHDYNRLRSLQGHHSNCNKVPILFYFTSDIKCVDEKLLKECVTRSERVFVLYARWASNAEMDGINLYQVKLKHQLAGVHEFIVAEDGSVRDHNFHINKQNMDELQKILLALKKGALRHVSERKSLVSPGSCKMY
ncbi:L-glutamine:2-deoxy-scyllo-inosose aminotransferase [Acrasis kona]|uniref:BtrR n=1 Tax=Acrasis kona TaxID=1008807 RepID=A0AAW2ZAP9_9EUKA